MPKSNRQPPPKKKPGQATGHRNFGGRLFDVRGLASDWGTSEYCIRSRVRRGEIPYKKLGGRIVFLKNEIDQFLAELPGVDLGEVKRNLERRQR